MLVGRSGEGTTWTASGWVRIASISGGAAYLGEGRTRVDIVDADSISVGQPILSNLEVTYNEGTSGTRMIGFRVALSKAAAFPITVTCTTVAGSALPGVDYKAATKTATIAAGNLSTTIDILTYSNAQPSPDRTFDLVCTPSGSPAITVYNTTARARILDED